MSIVQISKIQVRGGNLVDIPQLSPAEFGWADDQRRLFIGNEDTRTGDPMPNNTEVLTVYSPIDGRNITGNITAAGSNTQIQFNLSGRLAGSPSLTVATTATGQVPVQGVTIVNGGGNYLQVPTLVFDTAYGNGANFAPNYQSKGLNVPIKGPIGPNFGDFYTLVSGGQYTQAPSITVQHFSEVKQGTVIGSSITVDSTANLVPGLSISGSVIPLNTTIESIDSSTVVTMSTTYIGTATIDVTFTDDRGFFAEFESVVEPTRVSFNSATVTVSDTSTLNIGVDNLLVTGGISGQVLSTDGNAGLSWVSVEGLTAGGSNNQLQFNNAGNFGGITGVTFDSSSNVLLISQPVVLKGSGPTSAGLWSFGYGNINLGSVSNLHISNGTSGQVLSTDGSGNLSWVSQSTLNLTTDSVSSATGNVTAQLTLVSSTEATTLTMPPANFSTVGKVFYIKDTLGNNRTGNTITIQGAGGDTIDGNTVEITRPFGSVSIVGITSTTWGTI